MLRKLRHSTSRVTHLPPLPLPQPEPNPSAPPPLLPFPFFLTTPQDEALRKLQRNLCPSTSRATHLPSPPPAPPHRTRRCASCSASSAHQPAEQRISPPLPRPAPQDEALRKLQRKLESLEGLLRQHPLARAADLQPRLEALLQKQVSWCCRSMSAGLI